MNWQNPRVRFSLIAALLIFLTACGVKGDPLPPEKPAELGRGRPTYRRATEGLKIQRSQNQDVKTEKDEDEDGHE